MCCFGCLFSSSRLHHCARCSSRCGSRMPWSGLLAAACPLRPLFFTNRRADLGCRARLCASRTFALGHAKTPLNYAGATARRHHPSPAEAHRRWRGRGASPLRSLGAGRLDYEQAEAIEDTGNSPEVTLQSRRKCPSNCKPQRAPEWAPFPPTETDCMAGHVRLELANVSSG